MQRIVNQKIIDDSKNVKLQAERDQLNRSRTRFDSKQNPFNVNIIIFIFLKQIVILTIKLLIREIKNRLEFIRI